MRGGSRGRVVTSADPVWPQLRGHHPRLRGTHPHPGEEGAERRRSRLCWHPPWCSWRPGGRGWGCHLRLSPGGGSTGSAMTMTNDWWLGLSNIFLLEVSAVSGHRTESINWEKLSTPRKTYEFKTRNVIKRIFDKKNQEGSWPWQFVENHRNYLIYHFPPTGHTKRKANKS